MDIDSDGHKEIIAVGNRFGTEVETTRYDAGCGLVMTLNSNGEFNVMDFGSTHFFVPDDAKCLKEIKLANGKVGILVGNNNGRVQLFRLNY